MTTAKTHDPDSPWPLVTKVDSCAFPQSGDGAEADIERLKVLSKARKSVGKHMKKLRSSLATSGAEGASKSVAKLLELPALRLVAAADCQKNRPVEERVSLKSTFEAASSATHFFAPPQEAVRVWAMEKTGGYRPICHFGLKYRLLHCAARTILEPFFVPKPFQYDCGTNKEGGVPNVIGQIRDGINAGMYWVVTLDIVKFFQSFTEEGMLEILPFPLKVIRTVVLAEHLPFKTCGIPHHVSLEEFLMVARKGGPQGSSLSALIGTLIVSQLPCVPGVLVFNWADNFVVMAASKSAAEVAAMTLIDAVQSLPGGTFQLKVQQEARHVADGFTALGHKLILTDGEVHIEPANEFALMAEVKKFDDKIWRLVWGLKHGKPEDIKKARRLLLNTFRYLECWAKAFKECDAELIEAEVKFLTAQLMQDYSQALGITEATLADLKSYEFMTVKNFYASS